MSTKDNSTPHSQTGDSVRAREEAVRRKILKVILIFSVVVIALYVLFALINPEALMDRWLHGEQEKEEIFFYDRDDELNSLVNEDYLQMDSRMFYHNPYEGTTYSIEEDQLEQESDEVIFFYQYFDAIRCGDEVAYSRLLSSGFSGDDPIEFTQQMIYDITVYPQTDGGEIVSYRVDYRIYRNNGTFRDDVGSDTIRPLMITLTKEGGELKIASISPYTSYVKK